jgi:hypothetical protein
MDAADRVLARLARLERLEASRAPPDQLLAEVRALAVEAEEWARAEGDARALAAALELRSCAEGMS